MGRGSVAIGEYGALGTLAGIVLSGPLALGLVQATHPQPEWRDAALFASSYHPVQLLPYLGGLALVASVVVLIASLHALARRSQRALANAALVFTAAFAALIVFNYVSQTTLLPALAAEYRTENAPVIAALSMANPLSLAWGVEMWGWALLGVATWLIAPVFARESERAAQRLCVANGVVSLLGALWTLVVPGWVMSKAGFVAFTGWSVLFAALAWMMRKALRDRSRALARRVEARESAREQKKERLAAKRRARKGRG